MSLPLLVRVLRDPAAMRVLSLADWELLLRQAAVAGMSATLAAHIAEAAILDEVPEQPRAHLDWYRVIDSRHQAAVRFEVDRIARALAELGLPLILLKGAAYAMAGLPSAAGRLFSDIDILVPKHALTEVEGALMLHGWEGMHHDAYDQRYYREWMHELPPMEHVWRGNVIDVHHAILPETARLRPDPASLRAAALPIDWPGGVEGVCPLYVLAPHDMVLHSAVHLFWDGEFDHGLRDLVDLHRLLRHFGSQPGFWEGLVARACELELERPLFYALRYCGRLLGTPIPATVAAEAAVKGRPATALLSLMDGLFMRALLPPHHSCADTLAPLARSALYLRGNWLRMPPLMLARHLFHKAFISPRIPTPEQA